MENKQTSNLRSNINTAAIVTIFMVLGLTAIYYFLENKFKNIIPLQKTEIVPDTLNLDTFSIKNLNIMMSILEIQEPNIVFNQCRLETGNYTSPAFKIHNNLFGFMKGKNIRHYNNWRESLIHYSHWQNINYSGGDYYKFLVDIHYAEDSLYVKKLKSMEYAKSNL